MSMFICSPLHTVAVALIHHNPGIVSMAQIIETARILRGVNNAAAAARYGDKPVILSGRAIRETLPDAVEWVRSANVADICKLIQCFQHQCDECPTGYPGKETLGKTANRIFALPEAGGPSAVWDI